MSQPYPEYPDTVLVPDIMYISNGFDLEPCHTNRVWGHWDEGMVTRRKAIGTRFRIPLMREEEYGHGGISLNIWYDHNEGTSNFWGLHFSQAEGRRPIAGQTAYIAPTHTFRTRSQQRAPSIDGGNPWNSGWRTNPMPRFTESGDYNEPDGGGSDSATTFPINGSGDHRYWLPNGTQGNLLPRNFNIAGYSGSNFGMVRYIYDDAWEAAFHDDNATWHNLLGYAGPGFISDPDIPGANGRWGLRGNLWGEDGRYEVKPYHRDTHFGLVGYPPPYFGRGKPPKRREGVPPHLDPSGNPL